jgi:hypothetical protein
MTPALQEYKLKIEADRSILSELEDQMLAGLNGEIDKFIQFRQFSQALGRGKLPPEEYFSRFLTLFGSIRAASLGPLLLDALPSEEMKNTLGSLFQQLAEENNRRSSADIKSLGTESGEMPVENPLGMFEGFLFRRLKHDPWWLKRWCVIENNQLKMFGSKDAESFSGEINLLGCQVSGVSTEAFGRPGCFDILISTGHAKVEKSVLKFTFSALPAARDLWMCQIINASVGDVGHSGAPKTANVSSQKRVSLMNPTVTQPPPVAVALPSTVEINEGVEEMIKAKEFNEAAANGLRALPSQNKWQLVCLWKKQQQEEKEKSSVVDDLHLQRRPLGSLAKLARNSQPAVAPDTLGSILGSRIAGIFSNAQAKAATMTMVEEEEKEDSDSDSDKQSSDSSDEENGDGATVSPEQYSHEPRMCGTSFRGLLFKKQERSVFYVENLVFIEDNFFKWFRFKSGAWVKKGECHLAGAWVDRLSVFHDTSHL